MRLSVRHRNSVQGLFTGYSNGQGPLRKTKHTTSAVWKYNLLQHKASPGALSMFLVVLKALSPYMMH
jgi:hypothetical protein